MDSLRLTSQYSPEADLVLYEGDCLGLLGTLPDGLVQLVITSPPYNWGKPYESRLHLEEYLRQQRRVIEQCVRVLSPRGSICWEAGNYVENGEILPFHVL